MDQPITDVEKRMSIPDGLRAYVIYAISLLALAVAVAALLLSATGLGSETADRQLKECIGLIGDIQQGNAGPQGEQGEQGEQGGKRDSSSAAAAGRDSHAAGLRGQNWNGNRNVDSDWRRRSRTGRNHNLCINSRL